MTHHDSAAADLDRLAISVIRGLAMDAPEQAKSGHQGTAMALAPVAHVLFTRIMRFDPTAPGWPDRDRFILSAGHASILQYAALHLAGYDLSLDDLKAFRQWGSRTPGHPEAGHTAGIEVTTGPLGQGFANGVGMAVAEQWLRTHFGADVCDHHIFAICSDGDLMEGVSHEAASLAGHLGLGRLVYVYDDNNVTIDGHADLTLSDEAAGRFEAYGWHVEHLEHAAEDLDAIEAALRRAAAIGDKPSLVILRTDIGYPSPKWTDHPKAHGNPFDPEEIARTKEVMGVPADTTFWIPDDARAPYAAAAARGRAARTAWEARFAASAMDRAEWDACQRGSGLTGWEAKLPVWSAGENIATRVASNDCLEAVADVVPGLIAGGADLTGNTGTKFAAGGTLSATNPAGRQVFYGVREHGMGSIMNGMALHGGVLPVGGTFLVFSDYMRPAVRLAALSRAKVVYSWSHDSIGVGEDGPTHQPVEHVMSLRTIPGLLVVRPADANEVAGAWRVALRHDGPTALILTRQNVPVLEGSTPAALAQGAYVLQDAPGGSPDLVLIGTGSEVELCAGAAALLAADGVAARVVSMPCWALFEAQSEEYRATVLPPGVPRLSVEAGTTLGWARWADDSVGLDRFGASAPGNVVFDQLGFTPSAVADRARALLARTGGDG